MSRYRREPWLEQLWRDRNRKPWRIRARHYERTHYREHVPFSGIMIGGWFLLAALALLWLFGVR